MVNRTKHKLSAAVLALLLLTMIAMLSVELAYAENKLLVPKGWCATYADGYALGYCWRTADCSLEYAVCPVPEEGQTDGYMPGLNAGLRDRDRDLELGATPAQPYTYQKPLLGQ